MEIRKCPDGMAKGYNGQHGMSESYWKYKIIMSHVCDPVTKRRKQGMTIHKGCKI